MRASYTNPSTADLVDGALAVAAGIGVVTLALFPLAIPILALTVVVRPNTQIRLSCQTLNANRYLSEPLNRAASTRPPKET